MDSTDEPLVAGQRPGADDPLTDALASALELAGALRMEELAASRSSDALAAEKNVYDLIVPNFNAADSLKQCLDSLIANTDHKHLIHVIDDASTDPRVDTMMRGYATRNRHIRYYRLPANLGFPGAVNVGLANTTRDVVLVNSDTQFPPRWLARMDRCRRSDPRIHVISPLSNNATICSVPNGNENNALPPGMSVDGMDRLVERTSLRRYPRVPTVVGFCMLMTREALDVVGPLDMVFGRGYGEEVDWCQRAWARGFESALCDDVYVYHDGGKTFSQVPERAALQEANQRRFEQRWPGFAPALREYCASNPLRYQQHRIAEALRRPAAKQSHSQPHVLHVTHGFDHLAGVEMFTRQLADGMREQVASTVLYPANLSPYQDALIEEEGRGLLNGGLLKTRVNIAHFPLDHAHNGVSTSLRSRESERLFADVLAGSGAHIVQFNHLANLGSFALPLIARALGVKVVIVLHDYFLLCPDWNLLHRSGRACGEARADAALDRCIDCLGRRMESRPGVEELDMKGFLRARTALAGGILAQADALIAPSEFVRNQFARAWGDGIGARIRVIPHGTARHPFEPAYQPARELRVAFLGNATSIKGIETFTEAANRLRGTAIRFRILGRLPPDLSIGVGHNVTFGGSYVPRELSRLLQDVDVVYIGSLANETYCYTLDESFRAGVPVIASSVGAIPERVVDGETGHLIGAGDVDALVATLRRLDANRALLADLRRNVARVQLRSIEDEVADYAAIYRELAQSNTQADDVRHAMARSSVREVEPPMSLDEFAASRGMSLRMPLAAEPVISATVPGKRATQRLR